MGVNEEEQEDGRDDQEGENEEEQEGG